MKRVRDLHTGEVYKSIAEAHRRTLVPYDVIRRSAMREVLSDGARFSFVGDERRTDPVPEPETGRSSDLPGPEEHWDSRYLVVDRAKSLNTRMCAARCRACPAAAFYFKNTTMLDRFSMAFDWAVAAHDIRGIPVDEFLSLSDSAVGPAGPFFISAERSLLVGTATILELPYTEFSTLIRRSVNEEGAAGFIGMLGQKVAMMDAAGVLDGEGEGRNPWYAEAWRRLLYFSKACMSEETSAAVVDDLVARLAYIDDLLDGSES